MLVQGLTILYKICYNYFERGTRVFFLGENDHIVKKRRRQKEKRTDVRFIW